MNHGEETIMPNWALEAMEAMPLASDIKVLCFLIRHRAYRQNCFSPKQIGIALEIELRTITSSLARLKGLGYTMSADGKHTASIMSTKLKQGFYKYTPTSVENTLSETAKNDPLNKGTVGTEELKEQNIKHTHIQISEPVLVSDSASAPSDVLQIPDSNFWEEMPDLDELETLASLEHQAETVFVPSQESPIKKIELEEKAQPDLKKVSGAAAGPVGKIVDKSSARFNPREVDLPESIPREAWLEWCQHRTEKRSPLTPISVKKQLAQLLEFGATGQTPQESIDHAIAHSWQGFYPIRKARAAYVGKPQTTQEANERMVDSAAALYAACLEQDRAKAAQRSLNA